MYPATNVGEATGEWQGDDEYECDYDSDASDDEMPPMEFVMPDSWSELERERVGGSPDNARTVTHALRCFIA